MDGLDELVSQLAGKRSIALYGAGIVGKDLGRYLLEKGIRLACFIVTAKKKGEKEALGLPIYSLEDLDKGIVAESQLNVVIAVSKTKLVNEIKNNCFNRNFAGIFCMTPEMCSQLADMEIEKLLNCQFEEYYIKKKQEDRDFPVLYEAGTNLPLFRVMGIQGEEHIEKIKQFCTKEEYGRLFGELNILSGAEYETDISGKRNITVYVVSSHRDKMGAEDVDLQYEQPIQVGAADTEIRKCFITDDTGDNISIKNRDYCECTALYWIWKNQKVTNGYAGLEHYRRRLELSRKNFFFLSQQYSVDVILGLPQFYVDTVYDFFTGIITDYDWQLMKRAIIEVDSEYADLLEQYEHSHFYFSCNLCIFKWEWLEKYCSFAFSVAEKIEKHFTKRNIHRKDRYMGYIFESLLSVFIMKHKKEMNILCTEVRWIDRI